MIAVIALRTFYTHDVRQLLRTTDAIVLVTETENRSMSDTNEERLMLTEKRAVHSG